MKVTSVGAAMLLLIVGNLIAVPLLLLTDENYAVVVTLKLGFTAVSFLIK